MNIEYLPLRQLNARFRDTINHATQQLLSSGRYLKGDATAQFEKAYSRYIGTQHCVGCGNGFDALQLIFRAYIESGRLQPGDEVLVPANTFIASILAITENQLTPVLIEPRMADMQIDDSLLERAITPRTRAVLLVHLYGICAYTETIKQLCDKHQLLLIEDNAQGHGLLFHDQHTGSLGDAAAHSFYPSKNLGALGDAGAVTTNDERLALAVRSIANYGGRTPLVCHYCGLNSRMDEWQAAILLDKLQQLDADNALRKRVANQYTTHIHHAHISCLPALNSVYHVYPIFCAQRDKLQQYLLTNGIETHIHYPIPPHKQRCFSAWNSLHLPITERIAQTELSLPCHPLMTEEMTSFVTSVLNRFPFAH